MVEFIIYLIVCIVMYAVGYILAERRRDADWRKVALYKFYKVYANGREYEVSEHDFKRIVKRRVFTKGDLPEPLWQEVRGLNYKTTDWVTVIRK